MSVFTRLVRSKLKTSAGIISVVMVAIFMTMLAGVQPSRAQTDPDKALEIARNVVKMLNSQDYAGIVALFDDAMTKALTKEALATGWDEFLKTYGAYVSEEAHDVKAVQGYQVVTLTLKYEKTSVNAVVPITADGKVGGLSFKPVASAPQPTATFPAYINQANFTESDVKVGAETEWELPGTLSMPNGDGPFPAVVLVHGSGPNDRDESLEGNKVFRDIAWGLASQGIAVLRYDKRTFVYGKTMKVDGLTVKEETIDDAVVAVEVLKSNPKVNPSRIIVLGHSLGGLVAPRIAAQSKDVAGLILMAGLTDQPLHQLILVQTEYLTNLDGTVTPEEQKAIDNTKAFVDKVNALTEKSDLTEMLSGAPAGYWLDLRNYRPSEALAKLTIPVFVAQGERDYQVPFADFKAAKELLSASATADKAITWKSYPKLNHMFLAGEGDPNPQEYAIPSHVDAGFIADIVAWIKGL